MTHNEKLMRDLETENARRITAIGPRGFLQSYTQPDAPDQDAALNEQGRQEAEAAVGHLGNGEYLLRQQLEEMRLARELCLVERNEARRERDEAKAALKHEQQARNAAEIREQHERRGRDEAKAQTEYNARIATNLTTQVAELKGRLARLEPSEEDLEKMAESREKALTELRERRTRKGKLARGMKLAGLR